MASVIPILLMNLNLLKLWLPVTQNVQVCDINLFIAYLKGNSQILQGGIVILIPDGPLTP